MRDNHDGLPEILEPVEEQGKYFANIALERDAVRRAFRFEVAFESFRVLQQVRQIRPFDLMPGVKYRYFFVPSVQKLDPGAVSLTVRVQLCDQSKEMTIKAPEFLFANLLWFFQLTELDDAVQFEV